MAQAADVILVLSTFFAIGVILVGLLTFWYRKGAKKMYKAWAWFGLTMYVLLFVNYISPEKLLTANQVLFSFFVLFTNSTVTIFRAYKDSEKYIPKKRLLTLRKKNDDNFIKKMAKMKMHALWFTIKNGGNDVTSIPLIRNELCRHLR